MIDDFHLETRRPKKTRARSKLGGRSKTAARGLSNLGTFFFLRNAKRKRTSMDPWSKSRMVSKQPSISTEPQSAAQESNSVLSCTDCAPVTYSTASRRARRSEPPEAVNDLVLLSQGCQACWVLHPVVFCFPITVRSDHLPYHRPQGRD